jgi:hypothetical protein
MIPPSIPHYPKPSSNEQVLRTILGDCEGYVIFTQKKNDTWRQIGALPVKQAERIYEILGTDKLTDVYFTINSFYRVGREMGNGLRWVYRKMKNKKTGKDMPGSRQECNLQDLRCLYVDMDIYRHGKAINWRDATALVQKMADKGIIPHPTVFANSGRGAYALWTIKPHESKSWDVSNYKAINKALQKEFQAYSILLQPDEVFDGSRVLRLPGSINSKAPDNPVAYVMQYSSDGKTYEYTLEDVATRMSVPLIAKKPPTAAPATMTTLTTTPTPARKAKYAPRAYACPPVNKQLSEAGKRGMEQLGKRRMKELLEIINYKGVFQGFRYKTLFILGSTARIAKIDKEAATSLLSDLSQTFTPRYPGTDANDVSVCSIVEAAYKGKITKHAGHGLAKFFNLTTDECRHLVLRTIFTEEIATARTGKKRTDKLTLLNAIKEESPAATCLLDLCRRLNLVHGITLSKSQASRLVRKAGVAIGQSAEVTALKAA